MWEWEKHTLVAGDSHAVNEGAQGTLFSSQPNGSGVEFLSPAPAMRRQASNVSYATHLSGDVHNCPQPAPHPLSLLRSLPGLERRGLVRGGETQTSVPSTRGRRGSRRHLEKGRCVGPGNGAGGGGL